jgi:hypothetical protein
MLFLHINMSELICAHIADQDLYTIKIEDLKDFMDTNLGILTRFIVNRWVPICIQIICEEHDNLACYIYCNKNDMNIGQLISNNIDCIIYLSKYQFNDLNALAPRATLDLRSS